jgi:K(+)-stimulated pyrophosphate-energized sodium pump
VGYLGGPEILGGFLAGAVASGILMAIFQANSGGAWDNAKKMVEEGYTHDGHKYEKGSEVHKATVVGDTVGDPLKDTSGPSLNILIKLMSVVALVIAPGIMIKDNPDAEQSSLNTPDEKQITVEKPQLSQQANNSYFVTSEDLKKSK